MDQGQIATKMPHGALESQYTTRIWFFENHYDIWHKYTVYTSMSQRSCQNVSYIEGNRLRLQMNRDQNEKSNFLDIS